VEEVSGEFVGQAKFVKVDVEEAEDAAVEYGVMQLPTVLFFKGGAPVDKLIGLVPKPKLVERVKSLVG
jgi:thioredoxin 1